MSNNNKVTALTEVFDFSDEYISETIDLGVFNGHPFRVTVQEIPHGRYTQLQQAFIGKMNIPENKDEAKRMLRSREVDPVRYSDNQTLAAIATWTLCRKDGSPIDVCDAAWNALPHRITEKIEEAVKRVNPKLDDDFRGEDGSENQA